MSGNGGYTFFEIRAIDTDPARIHGTVSTNQQWQYTVTVENPGDTDFTGLDITLVDADTGDNVSGTITYQATALRRGDLLRGNRQPAGAYVLHSRASRHRSRRGRQCTSRCRL